RLRDETRELVAVHREGVPGRDRRRPGAADHQGVEELHFALQEADRVSRVVRAEGVGADELGASLGLVRGGPDLRPHFEEAHPVAAPGELPGALGARQPRADDRDGVFHERRDSTGRSPGAISGTRSESRTGSTSAAPRTRRPCCPRGRTRDPPAARPSRSRGRRAPPERVSSETRPRATPWERAGPRGPGRRRREIPPTAPPPSATPGGPPATSRPD